MQTNNVHVVREQRDKLEWWCHLQTAPGAVLENDDNSWDNDCPEGDITGTRGYFPQPSMQVQFIWMQYWMKTPLSLAPFIRFVFLNQRQKGTQWHHDSSFRSLNRCCLMAPLFPQQISLNTTQNLFSMKKISSMNIWSGIRWHPTTIQ